MSHTISKQLHEIVSLARLSPSSHNTQPWTIQLKNSDNSLVVGYNTLRTLPVGDPENRELYISLGCFIETLLCAARDKGLKATYLYLGRNPGEIATISFHKDGPAANEWPGAIQNRRSDRRLYEPKSLTAVSREALNKLERGTASLKLIDTASDIGFLAEMTHEATLRTMSNQEFRNELASWVRHNWTKRPDGMPGYTQGMPGPVSLLGPWFIKNMKPVPADQAKKDAKRVMRSAAIGLVCLEQSNFPDWIEAGRLYQAH